MEAHNDNWNACLLYRNKQLTKQLKDFQEVSEFIECSFVQILAMSQLLRLHQNPVYGIVRDDSEWQSLFTVIDMFYGGCLLEELADYGLSTQELRLCYLIRARVRNKSIAVLFNITPQSVLKSKQRIKIKLTIPGADRLNDYILGRITLSELS